ncbi:MAG TPA: hypothetical protein VGJ91_14805 [Polyangiaceae bacterium]|jgi:hypothetical protein
MALENAESLSDPFAPGASEELVPDSSPLRVSLNTQFESGIPPARVRDEAQGVAAFARELTLESGVQRLESALGSVLRTDANLALLARGIKHLAGSAQAASAANSELLHELDELRAHLVRSHEEEHALRFRMSQLEQLLDVIRHETTLERAFLIEQQDLFLVEIMTDHDRQLGELKRRLRESGQRTADQQALELIAQRDQAREYATRCERERDLAWQELAAAVATPKKVPALSAEPSEPREPSKSGATAIGSISLKSVSVPASSAGPETERSSERPATGYSLSGEDINE